MNLVTGLIVSWLLVSRISTAEKRWIWSYVLVNIPLWPFAGTLGAVIRSRFSYVLDETRYGATMGLPVIIGMTVVVLVLIIGSNSSR